MTDLSPSPLTLLIINIPFLIWSFLVYREGQTVRESELSRITASWGNDDHRGFRDVMIIMESKQTFKIEEK